jgi:hypothetical protein
MPAIQKFYLTLSLSSGFGGEGGVRGLLADDFEALSAFNL